MKYIKCLSNPPSNRIINIFLNLRISANQDKDNIWNIYKGNCFSNVEYLLF